MNRVLAIIPARGGSTGLHRKNIKELCGKPLVAYSIEAALKSTLIDRVIVSTEDEEIAGVAREWGAEVPFLRPKHLASDTSDVGETINYTIERLEKDEDFRTDICVTLFPTYPFKTPALIDSMVHKGLTEALNVLSVVEFNFSPGHCFSLKDGRIVPLARSNHSNKLYKPTGSVNVETILPHGLYRNRGSDEALRFINNMREKGVKRYEKMYAFHVINNPISLIDIDDLSDFLIAEEVLKEGLFNPG